MTLLIGTRGSALALAQAGDIAREITVRTGVATELVPVTTHGDVSRESLSSLGGTGVFVAALRDSLLRGDCDVAVHSLKDLPTSPADGLALGAIPERVDVRDVLCARDGLTLAQLPAGAKIGTGSPRRAAQLRAARPDLEIVDIRGNVDTRLGRVAGLVEGAPGDLDAVVLAAAGLARLGRLNVVTEFIDPAVMLPAPGQGALAVECRDADADGGALAKALADYDHRDSRLTVAAERAMLGRLEAGCTAPVGALAHVAGERITLEAVVCSDDGTKLLRRTGTAGELTEDAARALGVQVAEELLAAGAAGLTDLPAS